MLLLKREEGEHHSTLSPAIPSPRSQRKLSQTSNPPHPPPLQSQKEPGSASPSQCIFRVDAVQMFAKNPKAKKIFISLISCSLRRFYFVLKKKENKKVLWRNPQLRSYRLTSRAREQSVSRDATLCRAASPRLSFLANTNKRTK